MKPDYSGPERDRVWSPRCSGCARSSGCRRRSRAPGPRSSWCSTASAGTRSTGYPDRAARAAARSPAGRSPPSCRRPRRPRSRRSPPGSRRRATAITGFRHPPRDGRAQRDPLAAGRRRSPARSRHVQTPAGRSAGGRSRSSPRRCSAPPASPPRTCAAPSSTAGRPPRSWSSTSARSSPGGAPFVYAYYPGVDEVAHAYGLDGAVLPGRARGRRPAGRRRCSTRCPTTSRWS